MYHGSRGAFSEVDTELLDSGLLGLLLSNSSNVLRNLGAFGSSPLNAIVLILGRAEVPPTIAKRRKVSKQRFKNVSEP